jgi:hypothetical protein
MKKKFSIYNLILGLVIIVIGAGVLFYVFNGFSFSRTPETVYAEPQRIEVSIPASGFIAKDEKIYYAEASGKIKRIIEPGEIVKKGAEIAQITQNDGKTISVKAQNNGLVTYIIDNCEDKYNINNIDKLLTTEIIDPPVKQERVADGDTIKKGDFLFKIVGNDKISYILVFDNENKQKISGNKELVFAVEYPVNMLIDGKIEKIEDREDNKCLAVFSTEYYIDTLLNSRKISGRFVFGTVTASYLPISSLAKNEKGEDIVYIKKSTGLPEAFKVTVLGKDYSRNNYIVQGLEKFEEVYFDANLAKDKISKASK